MKGRDITTTLADLREGKLREIGPRIRQLTPTQVGEVSEEVGRLLQEAVASKKLAPGHRWLITTLQHLALPEADDLLIRTLGQAIHLKGCCGCTLHRTMRAIGAVRPPHAIPALLDVICQARRPRHKHLAAVCIEKIVEAGGSEAQAILSGERARLRRGLSQLRAQVARTKPVAPPRPWEQPPGGPQWLAAAQRAIKGITRLLSYE